MAGPDRAPMLLAGYEALREEARQLKSVERPQIIAAIEEARAHGDLSENAEYHAAKEKQGLIEARLAEIEDYIGRAEIIDPATLSGDKVIFGATVTLIDEDDNKIRYQLVGEAETSVRDGRISYVSPLGRALIGRSVREEIEVVTPRGERYYEIHKIEFV